jgi:uncharacterized membrane protein YeaQ/YmgE (transglycosylase-associated protein family)
MDGVGFLGTIFIGLVAGWLASRLTGSRSGLIGNLVLGVIGAVFFGWLAASFNVEVDGKVANLVLENAGRLAHVNDRSGTHPGLELEQWSRCSIR